MPCRDYATDDTWMHGDTEKKELKERLDKVTELLCFVLTQIEGGSSDLFYILTDRTADTSQLDRDLIEWWSEHKRLDEDERIKKLQEFSKDRRAFLLKEKLQREFSDEEIEELKDLI